MKKRFRSVELEYRDDIGVDELIALRASVMQDLMVNLSSNGIHADIKMIKVRFKKSGDNKSIVFAEYITK